MRGIILFRGKRKDNGEWLCGDLRQYKSGIKAIFDYRSESRMFVVPETIGQYTGLTDKNGTKIFEGDILKNEKGICFGGEYKACVEYSCDLGKYRATNDCIEFEASDFEYLEVIGNIFDNPELLKGGEGE